MLPPHPAGRPPRIVELEKLEKPVASMKSKPDARFAIGVQVATCFKEQMGR